jgi:hypothetical protein
MYMLDSGTLKLAMAASAISEGLMPWREALDRFSAEELRSLDWDEEVLTHPAVQAYLRERGDIDG